MRTILLVVATIFAVASNGAASAKVTEQKLTMRGRIIFPSGLPTPIESDGILQVELQDTSIADAPAKVIARGFGKAIRFPMAFAIKYSPKQIVDGLTYSLRITIRNKNNELLYTNDAHIGVNPIGVGRTTFIDAPVVLVKKTAPVERKHQWPELIGLDGDEAVRIIKKETGFTNVKTIVEGSPVTLDYRTDRVRIFVDKKGIVTSMPTIG
ncbi:unnamed protein product [Rotaria socialis]|uniref:Uncharacterized protein n=1 Tax=Rotaria socialis TaxID=392032 RepID=A0A820W4Z2_9BILA|nr:unnamed protein product [Rotaria socialis]CAF4509562.1 unnamed protein product [Rotaria socialis]